MKSVAPSDGWAACTWDGAREDVIRRGKAMTFREKVIWLEQAARLSIAIKNGRPKNSTSSQVL